MLPLCSIKDGDTALFMNDSYGNYLALAFDKIYYLNDGSIQKLNDLSSMGKAIHGSLLLSNVTSVTKIKFYMHTLLYTLVVPQLDLKR